MRAPAASGNSSSVIGLPVSIAFHRESEIVFPCSVQTVSEVPLGTVVMGEALSTINSP